MPIKIESIQPKIGLPGGEIRLLGKGFEPEESSNISVFFGDTNSRIDAVSKNMIMTTIPEDCTSSEVTVQKDSIASEPFYFKIPLPIITGLHLVDNPTIDSNDTIYATFSGGRGENTPISVFKVVNFKEKRIYLKGIVNATSLTIDNHDVLYILSRFNGKLYRSYGENDMKFFRRVLVWDLDLLLTVKMNFM